MFSYKLPAAQNSVCVCVCVCDGGVGLAEPAGAVRGVLGNKFHRLWKICFRKKWHLRQNTSDISETLLKRVKIEIIITSVQPTWLVGDAFSATRFCGSCLLRGKETCIRGAFRKMVMMPFDFNGIMTTFRNAEVESPSQVDFKRGLFPDMTSSDLLRFGACTQD